jgi:hypothetical protein
MAITPMATFPSIMILMIFIISIMMATLIVTLVVISVAMIAEVALDRQTRGRAFALALEQAMPERWLCSSA